MDYKDFKYWFSFKRDGYYWYWDKDNPDIKKVICSKKENQDIDDQVKKELSFFLTTRKEGMVGQVIDVDGKEINYVIEKFDDLFEGIIRARAQWAGIDPDTVDSSVTRVLSWLHRTDFYDAPASTRYHESFKHGLLYHTLQVYNNMIGLLNVDKFSSNIESTHSAALVCLCHDWCKIGLYESYKRNVKNEDTGRWEQVDAFRTKGSPWPFGHGVTSMYLALKHFKLTDEEALAIRFHMGKWQVEEAFNNDYQESNERFPLVLLTQFADQLAITSY